MGPWSMLKVTLKRRESGGAASEWEVKIDWANATLSGSDDSF